MPALAIPPARGRTLPRLLAFARRLDGTARRDAPAPFATPGK
jgi:hypothetical protein